MNASGRGSTAAETTAAAPVVERITVALVPKAGEALGQLCGRTGLSKTDIVNRAIVLYEFIDAELATGNALIIRDPATGEKQIHLL